jgi:hypothetical protein
VLETHFKFIKLLPFYLVSHSLPLSLTHSLLRYHLTLLMLLNGVMSMSENCDESFVIIISGREMSSSGGGSSNIEKYETRDAAVSWG